MENLEIRILPMSKKEFYGYIEIGKTATIKEIQEKFFLETIKKDKDVYMFKKKYLKTTLNSLVIFQYDNHLIASATYKGVYMFEENSDNYKEGYLGYYIFDKDSIKIFNPISNEEFQIIKKIKFSQAMHNIDYNQLENVKTLINSKIKLDNKVNVRSNSSKLIKKIVFNKFRSAKNLEIKIGENLTIIAGQNGTMKSTLLACIAQPFGIERGKENDNFDSEILDKCKIVNNSFKTQINKIFKLSSEFDVPGEHDFDIYFDENLPKDVFYENPLKIKSYKVDDRTPPIRFVTGKKREAGKGNILIPVIYLGLSRLYPLGESEINQSEVYLTKEEKEFLYENYKKILLNYEENYVEINQISKNKNLKTLGISTNNYDWQAISAGQDNIGKIICTILEFQRLKDSFKEKYLGGILLIDEVESTLFPKAQQELIKFLNKQCQKLKLKIICTTHSIEILKECVENKSFHEHTVINFLNKTRGHLTCETLTTFEDIYRNLLVLPKNYTQKNLPKIKIFTEDVEGEWLLKKLIEKKYKEYIDIVPLGLGFGEIANIAYKLSEIKEGIVIYDADVKGEYKNSRDTSNFKQNLSKFENYLFLPGEKSVEEDFIKILKDINNDENEFWDKCNNDNKQLALKSLENYNLNERSKRKEWFIAERENYGEDGNAILEKWLEKYNTSIVEFKENFKNLLKKSYLEKYGINLFNNE